MSPSRRLKTMNWTFIAIFGIAVVVLFALKRMGLVSVNEARNRLQAGALVVDVRSEQEFRSSHLPNAINLPLGEIRQTIERHAPDKTRPVLLHCLSGGRSEIAKRMLRAKGYRQVFNLGSYARAQNIIGPEARPVPGGSRGNP